MLLLITLRFCRTDVERVFLVSKQTHMHITLWQYYIISSAYNSNKYTLTTTRVIQRLSFLKCTYLWANMVAHNIEMRYFSYKQNEIFQNILNIIMFWNTYGMLYIIILLDQVTFWIRVNKLIFLQWFERCKITQSSIKFNQATINDINVIVIVIVTTLFWMDSIFDKYINFQYGPL